MTESVIIYPVKFGDFAGGDITTPFADHTHAPLGVRGLEGIDVVDEGGLGGNFEVTDNTVTLQFDEKMVFNCGAFEKSVSGKNVAFFKERNMQWKPFLNATKF